MSRILVVTFALLLGACATVPPQSLKSTEERQQLWHQHQQGISQYTDWSLVGRIVVKTDDDGWNGELHWSQSPRNYQIQFSAPFGQGAFQMDGNNKGVEMRLSDGQIFQAPDAESLLLEHVGWRLPLSQFRYWVTGIPENQNNPGASLNNNGQLAGFNQGEWTITYPEYFAVGHVMMPRKVYFKNHALSVRLVIDRWVLKTGTNILKQSYEES